MIAHYPKEHSKGKIIISKRILFYSVREADNTLTIFYKKKGELKSKSFTNKRVTIKKDGVTTTWQGARVI